MQAEIDAYLRGKNCGPIEGLRIAAGVTYGNLLNGQARSPTETDTADEIVDEDVEDDAQSEEGPAKTYEETYDPITDSIAGQEKDWMRELDGTAFDTDSEDEKGDFSPSAKRIHAYIANEVVQTDGLIGFNLASPATGRLGALASHVKAKQRLE